MTDATSQQHTADATTEFAMLRFIISSYVAQIATSTLVRVVSCTNSGGVSPWGMVDVQPVISQVSGGDVAVQYQQLYRLPYCRLQGGSNAVIIDPEVGDLGVAIFASRDISALKKQSAIDQVASGKILGVPPASGRQFSISDGIYLGGILNGAPQQYVQFNARGGITVVSPTKISLVAPTVEITASDNFIVQAGAISGTADSSVTIDSPSNDIKGGGTKIDNKPFLPHEHSGVQSGPSNTGGVV